MLNLFKKSRFLTLLTVLSINTVAAYDYCCEEPESRVYIGGFGGGLFSNSSTMSQTGTAFFLEAQGGPLAVYAKGRSNKSSTGFGGAQIGYERSIPFGCSGWSFAPAGEIEAFFYSHNKKGTLINDTDRLEAHDFINSFKLDMSLCLVNVVFSLKNPCWSGFTPYIGGGIGAAHIALKNADSLQIDPDEPIVNHYNSKRNDSTWAFAAQAKAGLRYSVSQSFHIFAEYRYVFVDTSNFLLGSTKYPTSGSPSINHVPTSPWNTQVGEMQYNAFAIGIQYDL